MTYASGANAAIVAASMKAERRVIQSLREAGATSSETAAELRSKNLLQRGALRRLVGQGAVRKTGSTYWLDEAAYARMTQRRREAARLILICAVGAAIVLAILALWMRLG